MGYYKKYGQEESVYNYLFVHADLIRMAKIVCEMIILNWQSNKMDIAEMLPLDDFSKSK